MRSRTFREGSVGLLLLLGLGVFGLIILWLNRFTAASNSYKAIVEFANAGGMQKGAVVRYRGVKVGTISAIRPRPNNVEVEIDITKSDLIIPSNVIVEANQSGLIGEIFVDITPKTELPPGVVVAKPLDKNCNRDMIVCNGSRLKGQIGISTDELIRSSTELATVYSKPEFYKNVNRAVENTAVAAASVAELTRNLNVASKSLQQQLNNFAATTNTVQRATTQLSTSSTRTLNQIGTTANRFGNTAEQFGATARELRSTTSQVNKLVNNLDTLVTSNRSSLVATLNNITETSKELRQTVSSLSPAVNRVTQGELIKNLETLSANAAQASTNLREVTNSLNNPNNVLVLQQTLDSARVTFENTQKITSDLDELTGDPAFRQNLRQLVNGLSSLVSSTQQMQQQVQVADSLDSVKAVISNHNAAISAPNTNQQQIKFNLSPTAAKSAGKTFQPTTITLTNPTQTSNPDLLRFKTSNTAVNSDDKTFQPSAIIFTPTQSSNQDSLRFNISNTAVNSAGKQPPRPTTSPMAPFASQENLLRQLREHREQGKLGE
ncbi:MlaD family protein [Scytonema sp. PCC 10023]|uniref:MlaD family protein n=1 Tax=Scytonema sp. PCC 10023 TaxID=1680591 RepID=UPI0039C61B34